MDASADGNARKVPQTGDPAHKIAPSGESVGEANFHVFTDEGVIDPEQAFDSYDFDEACNRMGEELFGYDTDESPDAIPMTAPSMTHTPVLASGSFETSHLVVSSRLHQSRAPLLILRDASFHHHRGT